MELNRLALARCDAILDRLDAHRITRIDMPCGARVLDCGVKAVGGLEAGRAMAEICMADLGRVEFAPGDAQLWPGASVAVSTDQPLSACMASQYAGWQITGEKFFAMGSGPMRAAGSKEKLFETIGCRETPDAVIGVLETGKLPPNDVCVSIAKQCSVAPESLTLLVAATSSIAGTVQVVARSIETALHKMLELGFDISQVVSGFGVAPMPPVASDDLVGIGRTNDAVLYGGEVTLWLTGEDERLLEIGGKIPSSASPDHGRPFQAIFEKYDRDFYKIDPLLFSPAVVTLTNLNTGRSHRFGETRVEVLWESFDRAASTS